jgi:hypothetical protein
MTWDGNSDMSGGGVFAALGRANKILIMFDASTDAPAYFANFRVAAGGRKLNDAIAENGRVATLPGAGEDVARWCSAFATVEIWARESGFAGPFPVAPVVHIRRWSLFARLTCPGPPLTASSAT